MLVGHLRYKEREAEKLKLKNVKSLAIIPAAKIDMETLVFEGTLTPKGIAIMLYIYENKKPTSRKIFYTRDNTLFSTLHLFVNSNERDLLLLNDLGEDIDQEFDDDEDLEQLFHTFIIRCAKINGIAYFFMLDSFVSTGDLSADRTDDFLNSTIGQFNKKYPEDAHKVVWGINTTRQQTDLKNCSYFGLKNLNKNAASPNFIQEILRNHVQHYITLRGSLVIKYQLPATYMSLAQSPDDIENFIRENKAECERTIRINKAGENENLRQYTYHPRDSFGVTSPIKVPNRNWQKKPNGNVPHPEFVYKNRTILYFRNKMCRSTVPSFFYSLPSPDKVFTAETKQIAEESRQAELIQIVQRYNAATLTLDPVTAELVHENQSRAKKTVNKLSIKHGFFAGAALMAARIVFCKLKDSTSSFPSSPSAY